MRLSRLAMACVGLILIASVAGAADGNFLSALADMDFSRAPLICTDNQPLLCGASHVGNTLSDGYQGASDHSPCTADPYLGPEVVHEIPVGYPTWVTINLTDDNGNLDMFLYDACEQPNNCLTWDSETGTIGPLVLDSDYYYLVVDGTVYEDGEDYTVDVICATCTPTPTGTPPPIPTMGSTGTSILILLISGLLVFYYVKRKATA